MTQAAASRLEEEGRFDFDVDVRTYVPEWPDKGHVITPRMLMAHTSGIRHYDPDGTEFYLTKHYTDWVEALEIFADDPLLFEPGTDYSYSTYGANLLGMAVQAAAGEDFYSVLKRYVFEPLGMRSTVGDHVDSIIPMRTAFYERTGQRPGYHRRQSSWGDGTTSGVLLNGPFSDNSNKRAGGGFLTTPEDLVRFGSAHLRPGFLRKESLDEILTSARFNDGRETGRGLNWALGVDDEGRRYIEHGGGAVGGTTDMIVYLDSGVVVAVQCNLTDANYDDLATRVAELFMRGPQ
jgi:CubicO group peptidase (beta-lactamase class C family)